MPLSFYSIWSFQWRLFEKLDFMEWNFSQFSRTTGWKNRLKPIFTYFLVFLVKNATMWAKFNKKLDLMRKILILRFEWAINQTCSSSLRGSKAISIFQAALTKQLLLLNPDQLVDPKNKYETASPWNRKKSISVKIRVQVVDHTLKMFFNWFLIFLPDSAIFCHKICLYR